MISKEKFVTIINKLKTTDDFVNEINDKTRQLRETLDDPFIDFFDGNSLFVAHTDLVVKLLENMFNDSDMISWWIFEMNYGRDYKDGYVQDCDGNNIDISTVEKLYDYLVAEMGNKDLEEKLKIAVAMLTRGTYPEQNEGDNDFDKHFISKDKIKEKIEELVKQGDYRTAENPNGRVHFNKEPVDYQLEILKDLLEEK